MRDNRSSPPTMPLRRGQVCVVEGFGIKIRVDRQHLVVEDGSGRDRRTRRYARATHGLSRLVVIGCEGYITLDAVRWLAALGIGYLHLDRDGNILAATENGASDARLRRLQACAVTSPTGAEIARYILGTKVEGQARNLDLISSNDQRRDTMQYWSQQIRDAKGLGEILEAEREAAAVYWSFWSTLPVAFASADQSRIPSHWPRVGTRHSPLSNAPRVAITPANAVLNYLYAILEAETRIACLALGLDPSLGIWHADYRSRDSLALDLMEAARPDVDNFALRLIRSRIFTRRDFGETSRGICRLLPPLALELAQTAGLWRDAIAPHVESCVRILASSPGSRIGQTSTRLTGANRRAAQGKPPKPLRVSRPQPDKTCKLCDKPLPNRDRAYCEICIALPQEVRYQATVGLAPVPSARRQDRAPVDTPSPKGTSRTSHRCKRCGEPVTHRKRVLCDPCFTGFRAELAAQRRPCKTCGKPVPHRKRAYCDDCLARRSRPTSYTE